jgi:hypothetical protein
MVKQNVQTIQMRLGCPLIIVVFKVVQTAATMFEFMRLMELSVVMDLRIKRALGLKMLSVPD